jgi:peptidoglycan/LPS O-acetylase OafA/YrhL
MQQRLGFLNTLAVSPAHYRSMQQQALLTERAHAAPHFQPSPHPAYRPDIDGLRAIAVLSVLLFHAFPTALPGGFSGVDVFFIISGFLISSIVIKGMQQQRFSVADFYARRIRRIFPALSIVMGACIVFGWFALFPDEYKMLGKHLFGGAAFVSNFFLWNEVGYFDTASDTKPLLHLWSLAVEEQFYLIWPPALMLALRLSWKPWRVALLLAALSFALNVAGIHHYASATFYSPASRIWELLLGAAWAGYTLERGAAVTAASAAPAWRANAQSLAGLALLVLGLVLLTPTRSFPGWWALLPTLGALLLIAAGPQAIANRLLLSNRVMVWIGLISYPLYLWHWPLLSFAHIIESGTPAPAIRGAALLLAVLLAWATYWLLERPIRHAANRRAVIVLSAAMLAVAAVGGWLYLQAGLPQRAAVLESAQMQKELIVVEDVANAAACKKRYGFDSLYQYCLLDDVQRDPTVLLIGDSHAYHLVAGLTRYYHQRGENLWMLGTRLPFVGMPAGSDPYQHATPHMMELALNTASVKTVIISTTLKLNDAYPDGLVAVNALRDTVRQLQAKGKQVIYVNDVPMLDFEPRACIPRAAVASSKTKRDCSLPRATFNQHTKEHDATLAKVLKEFPAMQLFDSAAPLCDAQRCHVIIDGQMMYRDTHHLSHAGDLYVSRSFARQFGN